MNDLLVDPARLDISLRSVGIPIRAKAPDGTWGIFDIVHLAPVSLLEWLRSRGGSNPWAENVVGFLLGHGTLRAEQEATTK